MIKSALLLTLAGLSEANVIDKTITRRERTTTPAPESYTDAGLSDLHDYTSVIELDIGSKTFTLALDTQGNELLLPSTDCTTCRSGTGNEWDPMDPESGTTKVSVGTFSQTVDYVYKLHFFETFVKGRYYDTKVCLSGVADACSDDFAVYAVESASPQFQTQADGYIGLGLYDSIGGKTENNVLTQL